jgi:hypothetical protein
MGLAGHHRADSPTVWLVVRQLAVGSGEQAVPVALAVEDCLYQPSVWMAPHYLNATSCVLFSGTVIRQIVPSTFAKPRQLIRATALWLDASDLHPAGGLRARAKSRAYSAPHPQGCQQQGLKTGVSSTLHEAQE